MSQKAGKTTGAALTELPRVEDRLSFHYLEHATVSREAGALLVQDQRGKARVPAARVSVLMLGPGTRITHDAMALLGDTGASVVWTGEQGVRMYASGRPLTNSSQLLEAQARLWCNDRTRLAVARKMYSIRYPSEDVSGCRLRKLLSLEGSHMKALYRSEAERTGVPWHGRRIKVGDHFAGDPINRALSAGSQCLYGLAYAVIRGLGLSPGLGFVHEGNSRSFVFDVADLYKARTSIPIAFDAVAESPDDLEGEVRRRIRDAFRKERIIVTMVKDLFGLLMPGGETVVDPSFNGLTLWDGGSKSRASGVNYATEDSDWEVLNGFYLDVDHSVSSLGE